MQYFKKQSKRLLVYTGTLLQWVVVAAVTGAVGGLVGSAFHIAVEKVTDLRLSHPWLLWLLPVSGAVIALLYQLTKLEKAGTDNILLHHTLDHRRIRPQTEGLVRDRHRQPLVTVIGAAPHIPIEKSGRRRV